MMNLWFRKLLNAFEVAGGICCIVFFLINVITLGVLAEKTTTDFVFKTLIHEAPGWSNPGIAWCLGLLAPVSALIGS
jgi:choline transport protein